MGSIRGGIHRHTVGVLDDFDVLCQRDFSLFQFLESFEEGGEVPHHHAFEVGLGLLLVFYLPRIFELERFELLFELLLFLLRHLLPSIKDLVLDPLHMRLCLFSLLLQHPQHFIRRYLHACDSSSLLSCPISRMKKISRIDVVVIPIMMERMMITLPNSVATTISP